MPKKIKLESVVKENVFDELFLEPYGISNMSKLLKRAGYRKNQKVVTIIELKKQGGENE